MPRLSQEQKRFLKDAMSRYHDSLPGSPAERFLEERNLAVPETENFYLGYVADPLPGHNLYQGMLAIPYIRWSPRAGGSVVSIRFRCLKQDCDHNSHGGKYNTVSGDHPRLFNTLVLAEHHAEVGISEGEIDAIAATVSGLPTVGVAGVEAWKPWFAEPFRGFETVYLLADGDEPGKRFAKKLAAELSNAKIIPSPWGEDVTSLYRTHGAGYLLERIKKK